MRATSKKPHPRPGRDIPVSTVWSALFALLLLVWASFAATSCINDGDRTYSRPRVEISTAETSGIAPLEVEFVSIVSGGIGSRTYAWDFGDGTSSTAANPTHAFVDVGTYVVVLRVRDEEGTEGAAGIHIVVTGPEDKPPEVIATIAAGECAIPGLTTVELDASASIDPEGEPLTYSWSFMSAPPGSSPSLNDTTIANPSFRPDIEGTYTLHVLVSDRANTVGSELLTVVSSPASQLSALSGELQVAPATEQAAEDLVVSVTNSCGLAVDNATVFWQGANASVLFGTSASTIDGSAINRATLGRRAGPAWIYASLGDDATRVTFDLTATAGPAARLLMNMDANPREASTIPAPVTFHVTDAFGNPTPTDVTFDLTLDPANTPPSTALFDDCSTGSKSKSGIATTAGMTTIEFCSTTEEDVFVEVSNMSAALQQGANIRIVFDDMEGEDETYTQNQFGPLAGENLWERGTASIPVGLSAYSGESLRGTLLNASVRESPFDGNPLRSVLSFPIGLNYTGPGTMVSARLSFQQFVDLGASGSFDCSSHATLRLGSPSGTVLRPENTLHDTFGCRTDGFLRSSSDWEHVDYDLTLGVGANTSLNWSLVTSASAVGAGWYIDDVSVTALISQPMLKFVAGPSETVSLTTTDAGSSELCQPGVVYGRLGDAFGNATLHDGVEVSLSTDSLTSTFSSAVIGQSFVGGQVATIESVAGEFAVAIDNAVVGAETVSVTAQVSGFSASDVVTVDFQDPSAEDVFVDGCSDGIDSDCDGAIDCDDTDCDGNPVCDCNPPYFDNGGRCARTYFMTVSEWIGSLSDCGGGHYHSCESTPYGFRFTDEPQPGSTTVTAIDIEAYSGVDCAGPELRDITVNGTLGTTFTYDGDSCVCSPIPNLQTLPAIGETGLAAYNMGGSNDLEIANPTSCEGFSENADFGGDGLWAVTVTY